MKIAFVINGLGIGGAENVVISLANELSERGHDLLIIYLNGPALILPRNERIELKDLELSSFYQLPGAYFKLRSVIKVFRPDVIHSHLDHANFLTRLVRLSLKIPRLITTVHNTRISSSFRALSYRLTNHLSDCFTNVSEEAVAAYVGHKVAAPKRLIAVHNGVDTNEFYYISSARDKVIKELDLPESTRLICAVGSFCEQKDYPNLFNAVADLVRKVEGVKVVIAGDGPLRYEMERLVARLGLEDIIVFLGIRRDINILLSASDVFVLSSAWEGFPMVVGEAMACETLVVATDCGGVKEFVGETGRLVAAKNSAELALALEGALLLPTDTRRRLEAEARKRIIDNFSIQSTANRWLKIYRG